MSGYFIAHTIGFKKYFLPLIAYVLGIAAFVIILSVSIILLPNPVLVSFVLMVLGGLLAAIVSRRRIGMRNIIDISLGLLIIGIVVFIARGYYMYNWTVDSVFYMELGHIIGENALTNVDSYFVEKRLSSLALLLSLGKFSGGFLYGLMPLLSLSFVVVFFYLLYASLKRCLSMSKAQSLGISIIGTGLLMTTHWFIFNTFYINNHLLAALYLFLVFGLLWQCTHKTFSKNWKNSIFLLLLISIPMLIYSRTEMILILPAMISPFLLSNALEKSKRVLITLTIGVSILIRELFVLGLYIQDSQNIPLYLYLFIFIGLLLLVAAAGMTKLNHLKRIKHTAIVALFAILFIVAGAFLTFEEVSFVKSLKSIFQNLVYGEGLWGLSLFLIIIALPIMVYFAKNMHQRRAVVFAMVVFFFISFDLAFLREGDYRPGPGDSFNRMVFHIFPLLIFYFMIALTHVYKTTKPISRANTR